MKKESLIKAIAEKVRRTALPKRCLAAGYSQDIFGNVEYENKQWYVHAAAFSELPEDEGKLFFRIISTVDEWNEKEVLADELSVESLDNICKASSIAV